MTVSVCLRVCVCVRESVCVFLCQRASERERERVWESATAGGTERKRERGGKCVSEKESESVSVCERER